MAKSRGPFFTACFSLTLGLALVFAADLAALGQESDCEMQGNRVAQILSFQSLAQPGQTVELKIHTLPDTTGKIEFPGSAAKTEEPQEARADENGLLSWHWQIPAGYQAQILPFVVTFKTKGRDAKLVNCVRVKGRSGPELRLSALTKIALAGDKVTCKVRTLPDCSCSISAPGTGDAIDPETLAPQKSNKEGLALWSFKIPEKYNADKLPLVITSDDGKQETKRVLAISIAKQRL